MKRSVVARCAAFALLFGGVAVAAPDKSAYTKGPGTKLDEECLVCHAGIGEEDAPKLDVALYQKTAHGEQGCVGCHADVLDPSIRHEEVDEDLAPADCASCHEGAAKPIGLSVHSAERKADRSKLVAAAPDGPVMCKSCHGAHDIRGPSEAESRVNVVRQTATCGQCHGRDRVAAGHPSPDASPTERPNGHGPDDDAEADAEDDPPPAACSSCHGSHAVRTSTDSGSMLYPAHVVDTCRACHAKPADDFVGSAHDEAAKKDGFDWQDHLPGHRAEHYANDGHAPHDDAPQTPPVCVTCHKMHGGNKPKSARFREDLVHECGTCHAHLMETYVETYHGKATLLGSEAIAKCSDCHGFHGIRGPDDPQSKVSPENKLQTCQSCHEGAPEKFAGFWAHADPHDRERFPVLYWVYTFMTTLLVSVFSFFGLHTLLWAIREGVDAVRLRGRPRHVFKGPRIQRFSTTDRLIHFFVIISFLGLAATGAPVKFAEASWARFTLSLLGGVEVAGLLHRIFAVITFGYFFAHVIQLAYNLWPKVKEGTLIRTVLGPDSLVPRWSDITDVFKHFGWFLGLRKKPTWERWTYWEKFDYWAVFWGVAIIGSSGLVLWFPTFFTRVLPGWAVNIALVVHSDEALLAIGFIFGVHFFNSHLRRSKFPMDEVMFTGSMPAEEFEEERGREFARLDEAKIQGRVVKEPSPIFRTWARVFGISAWLTGLIILGLIIHGFITTH